MVWEAEYTTWGNTAKVTYKRVDGNIQEDIAFQPLRFQGQYYDTETGLHYNRFRYYDPDIGRFVTLDPIGLLGGVNLYAYASNPISWIDPLGLSSAALRKDMGMSSSIKGRAGHHLIPEKVWKNHEPFLNNIGMSGQRDLAANGIDIPTSNNGLGSSELAHRGRHPEYSKSVDSELGDISKRLETNKITPEEAKQEVQNLQKNNREAIKNKTVDSHVVDKSGCEILS